MEKVVTESDEFIEILQGRCLGYGGLSAVVSIVCNLAGHELTSSAFLYLSLCIFIVSLYVRRLLTRWAEEDANDTH